jgi:hypothetical protein
MSDITVTLSKKNMRMLMKCVFIGNWVLTATKDEGDEECDAFYHTMLAMAKNYNIMDGIEYDEKSALFDFSAEKEEEFIDEIREYDEEMFWEELIDKLAERDAIGKIGMEKFLRLEGMERSTKIWEEEGKYGEEFEKHGVERLFIKK